MKMIVSDYDDTFYINDIDVKKNVELVNLFVKENFFVIATGRSFYDFKTVQDLYNIKCNYLIINHGATILKGDKIIYNKPIDNTIKNKILSDLDLTEMIGGFACSILESRIDFNSDNLTKMNIRYNSINKAREIYELIKKKYSNYVSIFFVYENEGIEIVSAEANKSKSIKYIAKLENIDIKDIYTTGNGYSDIEMLKDFNGYAMTNSIDELKQYSKKDLNSVSELLEFVMYNN